jgi:hypothetical protein
MAVNRVYLTSDYATTKAHGIIDQYSKSGFVMEVREPTRTDDQNRILHAIVDEIIEQRPDEPYSKEDWKLRFMQALRNETRFLPELDGGGMFPVGQRTSELNKTQFSALLEIVFEWCARNQIQLSDQAKAA